MRIGIVGRGRVGGAFARAFAAAGDEIVHLGRGDDRAPLSSCDVVIVAVPDDALHEVVDELVPALPEAVLLLHTSASRSLDVLAAHGERIGILHPPIPVASPEQPLQGIRFGALATAVARRDLEALIERIGGRAHWIRPEDQVRYHAALVHASNHLVALAADAAEMLGADADLLSPLLSATLSNLEELGPEAALTGPIVRGDVDTVRAHLAAVPQDLRASYRANALRALALAIRSGRLDRARAVALEQLLREDHAG